jgi:hypothetical protein
MASMVGRAPCDGSVLSEKSEVLTIRPKLWVLLVPVK